MSGDEEKKKIYYYIDKDSVDKIFEKLSDIIERHHELDSRQQLLDQKVKYHKRATEAEQEQLKKDLERREQQLRDELKKLRKEFEQQITVSQRTVTIVETLKRNWLIFGTVAVLLAYFLKDIIVSEFFGGG